MTMEKFPNSATIGWPDGFDLFHPKRYCIYFFGAHNYREVEGVFYFKKAEHMVQFSLHWTPENIALKAKEKVDPRRSSIFRRK